LLAGHFARFDSERGDLPNAQIEFRFQQTDFDEIDFSGWSIAIWIIGIGPDEISAISSWAAALNRFVEFTSTVSLDA